MAQYLLTRLQKSANEAGIALDVGEFPDPQGAGEPTDPERPVRLVAHAVARVADRIPFSRRISRHLEGTENRAGIFADLLALVTELARQNPDLVESWADNTVQGINRVRTERMAQQAAAKHAAENGAQNETV